MNTSELIGPALDWAVAKCADGPFQIVCGLIYTGEWDNWQPSNDWSQGGPIIEREGIFLAKSLRGGWTAMMYTPQHEVAAHEDGPTPLIAAMRCYVAARLGEEVDVPTELYNL